MAGLDLFLIFTEFSRSLMNNQVGKIAGITSTVQIGIVVDAVSEVINVNAHDIENTPAFGTSLDTDYILAMAKMEGDVKILLDIDKVLNTDEVATLEQAT